MNNVLVWDAMRFTYVKGFSNLVVQRKYKTAPSWRTYGMPRFGVDVATEGKIIFVSRGRVVLDTPENEAKLKVFLVLLRQTRKYAHGFLDEIKKLSPPISQAGVSPEYRHIGSMSGRIDLDKAPFTGVERGHAEDRIHRMTPPPGFGLTEAEVEDAVRQVLLAKKPVVDGSFYHE